MEAIQLVIQLLEKVSVLVATALVLIMLRPAEVWLGESGGRASVRRRIFLWMVFGGLAIWGIYLGYEMEGMQFNIGMVGILVAGYLGGALVGLGVGALAGLVYLIFGSALLGPYVLVGSLVSGLAAGGWAKKWGPSFGSVVTGAIAIQGFYHLGMGVMGQAGAVTLHVAQITANTVGVVLFMGLLSLVAELEGARREAQASQADAREARLEALQYQLQPHFLFNLLNTLAYLIRTSPARARELTLELADFLRYSLNEGQESTTLGDELEQIERYVELERARFGEGLGFEVEVDDPLTLDDLEVPPLILQPLVENAIRHGASDGEVDVVVRVTRVDPDRWIIDVVDDGPGPEATRRVEASRRGVGLRNVQERLERYYRGQASLALNERDDEGGACARVTIDRQGLGEDGLADQARRTLRDVLSQASYRDVER